MEQNVRRRDPFQWFLECIPDGVTLVVLIVLVFMVGLFVGAFLFG